MGKLYKPFKIYYESKAQSLPRFGFWVDELKKLLQKSKDKNLIIGLPNGYLEIYLDDFRKLKAKKKVGELEIYYSSLYDLPEEDKHLIPELVYLLKCSD